MKLELTCKQCDSVFTVFPSRHGHLFCSRECHKLWRKTPQAMALRFWPKVDKGSDTDTCWPWRGRTSRAGYGLFSIGAPPTRRMAIASRIAYQLSLGEIPDGYCVCHHCDNPACVNPNHLFLGTHTDNIADMDAKGRRVIPPRDGERNGHAKLTEIHIHTIRALYETGASQQHIGEEFGVSQHQISQIVRGKAWEHVPMTTTTQI